MKRKEPIYTHESGRRFALCCEHEGGYPVLVEFTDSRGAATPDGSQWYVTSCGPGYIQSAGWLKPGIQFMGPPREVRRRADAYIATEAAKARRLTGMAALEALRQDKVEVAANLTRDMEAIK
jgi:hypothetical protein